MFADLLCFFVRTVEVRHADATLRSRSSDVLELDAAFARESPDERRGAHLLLKSRRLRCGCAADDAEPLPVSGLHLTRWRPGGAVGRLQHDENVPKVRGVALGEARLEYASCHRCRQLDRRFG